MTDHSLQSDELASKRATRTETRVLHGRPFLGLMTAWFSDLMTDLETGTSGLVRLVGPPLTCAVALMAAVALGIPSPAGAAPPANDDYLSAQNVNPPGSEMPRDPVTLPTVDTSEATLQADLFSPAGGGPPEPAQCPARDQTAYGKTVWYAFYPDLPGRVQIEATGFDAVVAVLPFAGPSNRLPQGFDCRNDLDGLLERIAVPVESGLAYAVQVGGVRSASGAVAGGPMQLSVSFAPDRDHDGITDDADRCPTRPGTDNGCPPRIVLHTSLKWDGTADGVRLRYLRVTGAPRGARIDVTCRPRCGHARLRSRGPVTSVRRFSGRRLRAGAALEVRATKSRHFGGYQKIRVLVGDVKFYAPRCLEPGSNRPRFTCR